MFLVELTYNAPLEQVDALLEAHIGFLDQAYAAGVFLLSGRKQPRTGGIILARADSRQLLDQWLAQDPFWQAGVAQYRVTEFIASRSAAALSEFCHC